MLSKCDMNGYFSFNCSCVFYIMCIDPPIYLLSHLIFNFIYYCNIFCWLKVMLVCYFKASSLA